MSKPDIEYTEIDNNNLYNVELNKIGSEETIAINLDDDLSDINSIAEGRIEEEEKELILPKETNGTEEEEEPVIKRAPKRVIWADLVRIYASYLVVLTHVCWYNNPRFKFESHNWYVIKGYHGLSRACVPFFVMISGMFLLKPTKKITIKQIFTKYIFRIFKTYLFWTLYYAIINNYFLYPKGGFKPIDKRILTDMYHVAIKGYTHLWYLNFLIGLYLVTPLVKAIAANRELAWYAVILFSFFSQFAPTICDISKFIFKSTKLEIYRYYIGKRLNVEMAGSFTTYFLLGYLLSSGNYKKVYVYLMYLVGIIGAIATPLLKFSHNHVIRKDDEKFYQFQNFPIMFATVGGFMFFKYTINKIIEPLENKEWFTKLVGVISDCSFGIYLIHMTILKLVYGLSKRKLHSVTYEPLYWAPIYSLFIYTLCFIAIYLLRKIPFFKNIS